MQRRRSTAAFTIVVTVVMLLGAVAMGLVLLLSGAPGALVVGLVLALVPVAPLIWVYMWLDRYEPEPRSLLALGLGWGAFVATSAALILQLFDSVIFQNTDAFAGTVVAPVTEEAAKGLFIVLLLIYRRTELDGILDGLVYAGMVGIGFAFTENILYLTSAYMGDHGQAGGLGGAVGLFTVRCIFGPFAHPFFTSFTGIGIGIAVGSRSRSVRFFAPLVGYLVAVSAHALWNASLMVDDGRNAIATYVFLMVPAFLLLSGFAVWSRRREGAVLSAALADCAQRGFLDPAEIPWLARIPARRFARRHAERAGGPEARRVMVAYQNEAVELGFLHSRYLRGVAPPDFAVIGQEHVDRMRALRPGLLWPQPAAGGPPTRAAGGPRSRPVTHAGHSSGERPGRTQWSGGSSGMLTTLTSLREALQLTRLPLEIPGVADQRAHLAEMVAQLEDYVLPRLVQVDAPLLAVVGGSTGAGKSTLVNSLVGTRVSEPGVLRPTTRSPVLVHHPDDAEWFDQQRILPELERTHRATADPEALQLVASPEMPQGLALLDAPDIDSVVERNRALAAQLLAAADLWLFVTSAARYADQVPWGFLKQAAERSAAVAIVLDRTAPGALSEVSGHLARMLTARGLRDSPLFTVPELPLDERGLLPASAVEDIRGWLHELGADVEARNGVVRQTLDGAVRVIGRRTYDLADAAQAQVDMLARLERDVDASYDLAVADIDTGTADGTLLRGEVLARWQEYVGTGELFQALESKVSWLRDRITNAVKGKPQQAEKVTVAVESGLQTLLLEHAEAAAERTDASWRSVAAGAQVLGAAGVDLSRASRDFRERAERMVRDWQGGVLDMVRTEGGDKRATARFLAYGVNGLSVALMIVVFASTGGVTGAEVGIAGGSAVVGQKLLEAVFGDQAVRRLALGARKDLATRVDALLDQERRRFVALLDGLDLPRDSAEQLRSLARRVDDLRFAPRPAS